MRHCSMPKELKGIDTWGIKTQRNIICIEDCSCKLSAAKGKGTTLHHGCFAVSVSSVSNTHILTATC